MTAHTFDPNTQESARGGSQEFKVSQGYIVRLCLIKWSEVFLKALFVIKMTQHSKMGKL